MTKAEYIDHYGLEWYEQRKAETNARNKARYRNNPEYREYKLEYGKDYQKLRLKNSSEFKDYQYSYRRNDLNSNGKTKNNIRRQSLYILYNKKHHTKLKGYEIHHCFGYDDPTKFIYIPKSLHNKIHQLLRDKNLDADSNHFNYIVHLINECSEYTYISI